MKKVKVGNKKYFTKKNKYGNLDIYKDFFDYLMDSPSPALKYQYNKENGIQTDGMTFIENIVKDLFDWR